MHLVFHRTHTYFLSSPILLFHTFRCSMCFLFHMFHFSVFHYFFGNCNCFSGDFMPFCSVFLSFCRISVDFISFLFHFYFIYKNESCYGGLFKFTEKFNEVSCKFKKETPSLFRSSVSDICSSFVLSQFRRMMQNSAIPCFVTFRYFLLFGRSHPQSAPSPQSSFHQSCG